MRIIRLTAQRNEKNLKTTEIPSTTISDERVQSCVAVFFVKVEHLPGKSTWLVISMAGLVFAVPLSYAADTNKEEHRS